MGEIGNNFLPEDIFADVESDISNNVVRKNDQHMEEMVQDNNKANINQKKGKNFDKKHISKTNKKLFLVVLLFVFLLILLFIFIDVVTKLSVKSAKKLQNNVKNNIVVNNKSLESPVLKDTDGDGLMDVEEINFGTNVNLFDTDGDLISDGDEIKTYKTSPLNPDTDGDGLSDYDEIFIYKTNPLSSDTDGDGYRDMDEINNGYNPIGPGKMTPEYLKSIEDAKKIKEEKLKTKN